MKSGTSAAPGEMTEHGPMNSQIVHDKYWRSSPSGGAALVLLAHGRVAPPVAAAGVIDPGFAVLFVLAFRISRSVEPFSWR
jgi:hypothetical protein